MQKFFKKALCVALATLCLPLGTSVFAARVGDKTGKVLSTDIVTYIDNIQVPSFNIAGRTAIVVENLNAMTLPFGVGFDEASRTLTITKTDIFGTGGRGYFHFADAVSDKPVGTPVMDVLYTDIRTVLGDVALESFNIGGFTCIYADDLASQCGIYEWDETARTVNVYIGEKKPPLLTSKYAQNKLDATESVITKDETTARWASTKKSHLIKNSDGTLTALEVGEHINLEKYDSDFNLLSSFAIKKELPIFGALYVGKDYNYIAFGQENLLDDNSREVIRIAVYDKNFAKLREISINNCKTAIPFDASGAQMSEDDRYLVLHTSRSGYRDENGQRPQTQLTVIVDKKTWQVVNVLGKFQYNHTSHALSEFVTIDDGKIITANLSDAAPLRAVFMQQLDFYGKVVKTQSLFNIGGPLAANSTGVMIGGFEASDSGYLTAISTIDHSLPTGYNNLSIEGIEQENRDIYLLWADKENWEMRHTCLARYTGVALTGSAPYLVALDDGRYALLWQRFSDYSDESDTVCYAFVDKDGQLIGKTQTLSAQLSDSCQPLFTDGKVVWYVNTAQGRRFYALRTDSDTYSGEGNHNPPAEEGAPPQEEEPIEGTLKREEEKNKITEVEGI